MHHHQTERSGGDSLLTLLHLHLPDDAWPLPASRHFRLGPPRFFHPQRQGGWLLPPDFEGLTHGTSAWDSGHEAKPLLQTPPQGAATLRLTLRDDPLDPLQASRQTLLNGQWRFHAITAVAIP